MSLEDEIVKSRKKQTMMQMVAADKLAAKKKIEARRAKTKLLKSKKTNTSTKYNALEKAYIKKYGQSVFKGSVPTSDSNEVIKDKVTVTKSNSTKNNFMQQIAFKIKNENENKNIKKAGELENNKQKNDKKKSTSKSKWEQYSSIAAAKKAGSLYYSKGGKRFAAVYAEDLKGVKGSSPSAKLRAYLNDKEKKRK